jgi:agmatine deiminase
MQKITLLLCLLLTGISHMYAQHAKRFKLPAYRTTRERVLTQQRTPVNEQFGKGGFAMPANVRFPGEFEESQAIAISWSFDYDMDGNVIGVDTYSVYGYISAQCAKYISDELPVWIRVPFAADTLSIKSFMSDLGWPLTKNYKFFIADGDDWWIRDFGPNGIYYGNQDNIAFVDLKYYDGRDKDNLFPKVLAQKLGYPNYESTLYAEGGNLVTDGFGKLFYSRMVTDFNTASGVHLPKWSFNQTTDTIKNLFNSTQPINLPSLKCDGGTEHIDLYMKLIDEQTMIVAQYPSQVIAVDRQTIEDNYQTIAAMKSTYNRPFRIYRIPMPTNDDGTYATTCEKIDSDARTFINGITANTIFIYPSYSDDIDGNKVQTDSVTRLFKKIMPGYKIIPIDSRAMTTGGGAIHCITQQIPVENPVLFWHPSIDGLQPIQSSYHIVSKITNKSGIKKAVCKWRKKLDAGWSVVNLTDSAGYFVGDIQPGLLTPNDWFIYFLDVETNNGKRAAKPITGPEGYYQVYFTPNPDTLTLGIESLRITPKNHLFAAYPNPAQQKVYIPFNLLQQAEVTCEIQDITGKKIAVFTENIHAGMNQREFNVAEWPAGIYFYTLYINGEKLDTRKLSVLN